MGSLAFASEWPEAASYQEAASGRFFVELWELLRQPLHNGETLLIGKKLL